MGLRSVRVRVRIGYVQARQHERPAAAGQRRQVRLRVPHGREEQRLRVHGVRSAVKVSMAGAFSSKTIIVAGGTGALGRALSQAFIREGAAVVTTFRSAAEFQSLAAALAEGRSRLEGEQVEVTDEAAVRRLIEGVLQRHSRIDALVNAVGGYAGDVKLWNLETAL